MASSGRPIAALTVGHRVITHVQQTVEATVTNYGADLLDVTVMVMRPTETELAFALQTGTSAAVAGDVRPVSRSISCSTHGRRIRHYY